MSRYYFVKITNNNNHNQYDIIITRSKNIKIKMYGLKVLYNLYNTGTDIRYRKIFDILDSDYSWFKYDIKEFEEYNDAKIHRLYLMDNLDERNKKSI